MDSRHSVDDRHLHIASFVVLFRRLSIVVTHAVADAGLGLLNNNNESAVALRLRAAGPARPRDLQSMLGMTSGGVTRLVDRLVHEGLVRRSSRRPVEDGRGVPVVLTAAGRRAVDKLIHTVEAAHDDCRPFAKEALLHLEALGAGPSSQAIGSNEVMTCLAQTAEALDGSIDRAAMDGAFRDYQNVVLLSFAELEGGARPTALAELLGLSSGGVTKLVDRAVVAGLVRRKAEAVGDDKRAVVVEVTGRGRAGLRRALRGFEPYIDDLWAAMHWISEGVPTP